MLHHDVEKKCCLLTRFIVENLRGYSEKVRECLSIYLNTAEKIRLKISRNSVTLTDRTLWHNKIERIPISLIRECKVDPLSPKICYFANETVTKKYQIIVILCKSADDSFKLVNIVQHKINSQGHYQAHSQWLQNGNFTGTTTEEQVTPKTKHKTIASVEIISSPKLSKRFAWGVGQTHSLPQAPSTIPTKNELSNGHCTGSTKERKPNIDIGSSRRSSMRAIRQDMSLATGGKSTKPSRDHIDMTASLPHSKSPDAIPTKFEVMSTSPERQIQKSSPNKTYQHESDSVSTEQVEGQVVVMRKRRNINKRKLADHKSGLCLQDTMRSSVVQYDSDVECADEAQHLQHNSNGIARVVVGGNDADDVGVSPALPTTEIVTCESASSQPIEESTEDTAAQRRHSGDGANAADAAVKLSNFKATDSDDNILNNALEGNYDNVESLRGETRHGVPATVQQLLKSCELDKTTKLSCVDNCTRQQETTDDEDEEYQLVLTGLKQLTRQLPCQLGSSAEPRYPHQIIAAMSTSQLSNTGSAFSNIEPIAISPKQSISSPPIKKLASPPPVATPVASAPPLVRRRTTNSKLPETVEKSPRPQSVSSGLHLIRSNNELRRSARRTGQYKSIAEYEKLKGQEPENVNKNAKNGSTQKSRDDSKTRNSTYKSLGSKTETPPPLSPRNRRKSKTPHSTTTPTTFRSAPRISSPPPSKAPASNNMAFPKVQLRKEGKGYSSGRDMSKENDQNSRRASIMSISSVPNHIILRRVSSNLDDAIRLSSNAERRSASERKSRSFDRKNLRLSLYKQPEEEEVRQNGLTLVGSRNSFISHGRSHSNVVVDSRMQHHCESNGNLSLGGPNLARTPVIDGKQIKPLRTSLQWTPMPELKKKTVSKTQFVSLPNAWQGPSNAWNQAPWEQNPGFKRFFDSILAYGPDGSKCDFKEPSKPKAPLNQPDIVLESLTPEHSSRADDSDSESSIRSSASAYWPPEMKQQSNYSGDFEEAASWKFHSPVGKMKHPIRVP